MYALGTFINNTNERSDHASNIDLGVGMKLVSIANDGSPLVRKVNATSFFVNLTKKLFSPFSQFSICEVEFYSVTGEDKQNVLA